MRLALVTETFPPEINGVARTLGRWADTFRERGHEVHVIRPRQEGERRGFGLVFGRPLPFYRQVRIGVAGPMRLRHLLRKLSPDLVHIATEGPLGLSAHLAARWLRIPVASSFHTNFDRYAEHYGFVGMDRLGFAYLRWFHNRTRVTLVPSQATRARLLADGVKRVEIWSRGVDASVFSPAHRDESLRASLGLSPNDTLLVYVGRLAPEKNLPVLLQAFARLGLPRVRLALVGGGPLAEGLLRSPPPGVFLAGEQRGANLSRWYASGDAFAFPSLSETFGNVVLEAQASGLPVVGFDCQGVNEQVVTGVNGLLVPPGGELAPALEEMCLDPAKRRRMGEAGRERAMGLDWKPIFDDLEGRYRELIAGRL